MDRTGRLSLVSRGERGTYEVGGGKPIVYPVFFRPAGQSDADPSFGMTYWDGNGRKDEKRWALGEKEIRDAAEFSRAGR